MPDATVTLRTRAEFSGITQAVNAYNALDKTQQAAARSAIQLTQSMARIDGALKGPQAEATRLRAALQNAVALDPRQAIASINQIVAAEKKAAGDLGPVLPRSLEKFGGAAIGQLAGGLGIAAITGQVIEFGKSAFVAANSLEKTESTTAALAGSTQRYGEVLRIAKAGQTAYGGSLEENLRGLGSLVNLSNRAGVELGKLDNISRRLALVDPVQGIEGANIALKEFLAGNGSEAALSLARRFELPRAALAKLAGEGVSAKDRLAGLDALLNQQGITSQVLTDRTKTTAATYDRLGAAAENASVRVGSLIAELLKAPAQNLTISLNKSEEVATRKGDLGAGAAEGAKTFNQYQLAVKQADQTLLTSFGTARGFRVQVDALSEAQFNYVKALQSQGVAADQAVGKAQQLGSVFSGIAQAQITYRATTVTTTEDLSAFSAQLLRVATSGDVGRAGTESLIAAYNAHTLTTGQLIAALSGLEAQQQRNANINTIEILEEARLTRGRSDATAATLTYIGTMQASAQASIEDIAQKGAQSSATALLSAQSKLAVDTFLSLNPTIDASAAASKAAADGYSPQIQRLIVLAAEARNATAALGALNGGGIAEGRSERDKPGDLAAAGAAGAQGVRDRAAAAAQALANQIIQTGTATQVVAERQKEYNQAVRQFGKDSAQAISAQTNLIQAQQSANKPKGGAGGKGLGALDRVDIDLAGDYQAQLDAVNARLAAGHLTELQTKQLKKEQLDLQKKITEEQERTRDAALDAQIAEVQDREKRRQELKDVNQAQRILSSASTSAEQKAAAQEVIDITPLEQEKRARDIASKAREGGIATPGGALPVVTPIAGAAEAPTGTPAAPSPANTGGGTPLVLQLDGREVGAIILPFIIAGLRSGAQQLQARGGG